MHAISFVNPFKSSLIALFLALLIIGIEGVENQNLFWGPLHDSAHTFAAFLSTSLIISLLRPDSQTTGLRLAQIGGALFTAGIALELIQPAFGRSASFADIYYNFIGIVCALAMTASRHLNTAPKLCIRLVSVALLLSSLTIPAIGAATLSKRDQAIPSLLNFEDSWQRRLYRAGGSANLSLISKPKGWENGSTALKVDFPRTKYPGFSIPHIFPDWRDFKKLKLNVFSKSEELIHITLRVHDKQHDESYKDRFNQNLEIKPGLNSIEISLKEIQGRPEGRKMEMATIAGLTIFSVEPKEAFSLYFDDLRLE